MREFVAKTTAALKQDAAPDLFQATPSFDVSKLEKMIGTWHRSIQFTSPRASVKNRDALVADVGPIFLPTHSVEHKMARSRRTAAKIAAQGIETVIARRNPEYIAKIVKTNLPLKGECASHEFPVALKNGHLIAALETLSFEIKEDKTLELELDSVCWTCADVKKKDSKTNLAVFALEPRRKSNLFDKAGKILRKLDVTLVTEDSLEYWARKQVTSVVPIIKRGTPQTKRTEPATRRRAGKTLSVA